MKKILFLVLCVFAISSNAFIVKEKKKEDGGKKQVVIAVCEKLNNKPSKEFCISEREKKKNNKWNLWGIKGKKKASFKKYEDALEECCLSKKLK